MSAQDQETKRLMKYLRDLDFLHKKEPTAVKSILTMINHFFTGQGEKKLRNHHELAEKMLDYGVYRKVVEYANDLIQDQNTHDAFMKLCREDSGDLREALVIDYLEALPVGSIYTERATLTDLVNFFRRISADVRYFIIVDDVEGALKGIVSVNDFTRNLEQIKIADKTALVTSLEFYNSNPKSIVDTDTMDYAANLFYESQQAGRKITKLLVVNSAKKPVGFIAESEIVRWEALNL